MIDSLYAIIDAEVADHPLALTFQALNAGCAIVQLRAKRLDDVAFLEIAKRVRSACAHAKVPFVVNDRADIARLVGADGLHLGQDDLCIEDARRVVGDMQIGVSTHTLEQAAAADAEGADLIAFGPVFKTRTKENPDPVVGIQTLEAVCQAVSHPVVAIGGITPENASEPLRAGARYIAVISALPRFLADAS
ncbi:MAG: thiamine phosphate synthase [Deltaproteobacteria bacterium]|nr:MAG: thiamine phosphate synthase [Deltaproteobacteria bacterium]